LFESEPGLVLRCLTFTLAIVNMMQGVSQIKSIDQLELA
jgi:hypothetical protein